MVLIDGQLELIPEIYWRYLDEIKFKVWYTDQGLLVLVQIVGGEDGKEELRFLLRIIDRSSYFIAHMTVLAFKGGWYVGRKFKAEGELVVADGELGCSIGAEQVRGVVQVVLLICSIFLWNYLSV